LVKEYELEAKISFKGYLTPDELTRLTPTAYIGLTLFESKGLNQYRSLANRFFDYAMAGVPQICVNYPEYAAVNNQYHIASMINDTEPATIATALNNLLADDVLHEQLKFNCLKARTALNWENEQQTLLGFYHKL
jgi:hypothetical protein